MWPALAIAALFFLQSAPSYEDGMSALEQGRYADAETAFQAALEAAPDDYAAAFHLALAQSLDGKDSDAIAGYQHVLELKPGLYEAELNLGILLFNNKEPERAAPLFEDAAGQKPDEFRPAYYLAESLLATGDYPGAEQRYRAAAAINDSEAGVWLGLARSLVRQEKLDDAAPYFRKAADLDPETRDGILELAAHYETAGRNDEAIAIYREFPDDPAVEERMGQLLLDSGKAVEAVTSLQQAVQTSPTAANRYALAVAYIRQKRPDMAAAQLAPAVEAAPDNFDLRMTYGRLLRDQHQFPAAAEQFLQASRLKPDAREAFEELAGAYAVTENWAPALDAIDHAEQLDGARPGLHFLRAVIYDKQQLYEPALASYQRFLELSKGDNPDEEFQARQRVIAIQQELSR